MHKAKIACSALFCAVLLGFYPTLTPLAHADIERVTVQEMRSEYERISQKNNAWLFWDRDLRAIYPTDWQASMKDHGVLFTGPNSEMIEAEILPLSFLPETFQAVATGYAQKNEGQKITLTTTHLEYTSKDGTVHKIQPFDAKLVLLTTTGSSAGFQQIIHSLAPQDYDLEPTDLSIQCKDNTVNLKKFTYVYPTVTVANQPEIGKKISHIFSQNAAAAKKNYLKIDGRDNLLTEKIQHVPTFHNNKYLSFLQSGSDYMTGAVHPTSWKGGLTFDLATGEEVLWQDVVRTEDTGSFTLDAINTKIKEDTAALGIPLYSKFKGLKKLPENYYLDKNGLIHFIFGQYEIAPYSSRIIDINMKKMCKD